MWPGQQPPGGEQNPQDQNPYQQPGYQQPNPYQQPGHPPQQPPYAAPQPQPGHPPQPPGQPGGYGSPGHPQPGFPQPNPYQQPTAPQYGVPGPPPGAPLPPGGGGKNRTTLVAIVAATAVVVTAGVTGFLVLKDDEERTTAGGDGKPSQSASRPDPSTAAPTDNPRAGSDLATPTVPGWKVVHNPKYGTLFDVPAEWEVASSDSLIFFEDKKKGDGTPLVTMSAPAFLKKKWCTTDSDKDGREETSGLSTVGTKGGQGAKSTAEAAYNEAANWVWAGFSQQDKNLVKIKKSVPYTSASGLSGHVATATALGTRKTGKCDTDGKSIAFTFKNKRGDFASWVMVSNAGVKDEVPEATIQKILRTVRLVGTAS
ncbi:hypothetical protein [Streptomyces sp. NPDC050856]|uniref:hypothetical protein n=1 Tax=Streptomyces sp. NPDC050856 TaxID=3154939 RepID=UPI0033E23DD1